MPFSDFSNSSQNLGSVPGHYRNHPALKKLSRADGAYVRPVEDPFTIWAVDD